MYDDIAARGGNPIMWKTGHSLIKAKMKETQAELAGEMSGHMFFGDRYYGFDDALYAACRLMEIVANSGHPLSYQLADLPKTVTTPEIRFDCPDELKFDVVRRVRRSPQEPIQDHRCRWRPSHIPARLGPGARVEYATRAGDAFRSRYAGAAGAISVRGRRGCRRCEGRGKPPPFLRTPLHRRVCPWGPTEAAANVAVTSTCR